MDKKLKAEYIVPGVLVTTYAGLPVDILNTAIGYMRLEFTHDRLQDLVSDIGDDDELVITLTVTARTPGD